MSAAPLRDHLARTDTVFVITWTAQGEERRTPIWSVVVDDDPYIRSVDGASAFWYRRATARGRVAFDVEGTRIDADVERVDDATTIADVDAALEKKYDGQGASVAAMLKDSARECTLRLVARKR